MQVVPLTEDFIALLAELRCFDAGDCLFSKSLGAPCHGFSKARSASTN